MNKDFYLITKKCSGDVFISAFDSEEEARREAEKSGGEISRFNEYDEYMQACILDGGIDYDYRKEVIN